MGETKVGDRLVELAFALVVLGAGNDVPVVAREGESAAVLKPPRLGRCQGGDFPGRLKKRVFNVVLVDEGNGNDEGAAATIAKKVVFVGSAMNVLIPAGAGTPGSGK